MILFFYIGTLCFLAVPVPMNNREKSELLTGQTRWAQWSGAASAHWARSSPWFPPGCPRGGQGRCGWSSWRPRGRQRAAPGNPRCSRGHWCPCPRSAAAPACCPCSQRANPAPATGSSTASRTRTGTHQTEPGHRPWQLGRASWWRYLPTRETQPGHASAFFGARRLQSTNTGGKHLWIAN